MPDHPKIMDLQEFRELGYLQEVNRRFFHPLGMALAVVCNADLKPNSLIVYDARDDDEGFYFGDAITSKPKFEKQARMVEAVMQSRAVKRARKLGFVTQPAGIEEDEG